MNLFWKYLNAKSRFQSFVQYKHFLLLSLSFENTHFCKRLIFNKQSKVSQKWLSYSENRNLDFFRPVKIHLKFHMQKYKGLGTKWLPREHLIGCKGREPFYNFLLPVCPSCLWTSDLVTTVTNVTTVSTVSTGWKVGRF